MHEPARSVTQPVSPESVAVTPSAARLLEDQPNRRILQLANGLLVIAQRIDTAPVVSVQCWVKTGSIYEQEFVGAGLSHFLEHLLSGGTTQNRTEQESNRLLGQIGARTNAATSLDTVRYHIDTTSTHAVTAIELLSDWMQNSLITQEEFDRERDVIQKEFSMGDGEPARVLWKLTQQARYQAHPARHPTIGYLDEFLRITPDQIRDFYRRMYVPNNMLFVVVGDIDPKQVTDQLAALWEPVPAAELPPLCLPVENPIREARTTSGVADIVRPRLRLAWPTTELGTPDDYALDLLAAVLGQGESSRLVQTLRNKAQSVTSITAYHASFHWGQGFLAIDAEVAWPPAAMNESQDADPLEMEDAIARVRAQMQEQLQLLVQEGITPEELLRAKRQIQTAVILSGQTAHGLAARLAQDMIARGDPDDLHRYLSAIESITAEDLQQVADHYLNPNQLIQVTLLPKPPGQTMPKLARPQEDPAVRNLPCTPAQLDNAHLVKRFENRDAKTVLPAASDMAQPLQTHILPNGLRVILGRHPRLPAVAMQFFHVGGLLADQPGREGVASATAEMLLKGTITRSALQLANQLDNLGASLSVSAGNNTWFVRGLCLRDDWQTLLAITADILLHPTFPAQEWHRLQPRLLAAIDRQNDSWSGELRTRFLEAYYPDHPWSVTPLGRREIVASLTAEDLRRFHQAHLDASQAALAIVGDIDPDAVLAEVEKLLAHLPAQAAQPLSPAVPGPVETQTLHAQTRKPVAAVQIGYGPGITRSDPDFPALQVIARVLSSFPTGWLDQALRGQGPGLVYAVGAGQATGLVPGYFSIVFNSSADQVPLALERIEQVIARLQTQPIALEDLQRAKASLLTDEFLGKQTLADLAQEAALNSVYGLPLDESRRLLEEVEKLAPADLQAVAQRRFQTRVTVILSQEPVSAAAD